MPAPRDARRVLVVDDDPSTALILRTHLDVLPTVGEVRFAPGLAEAERLWSEDPGDLVLLDLHLPDMPAAGTVAVARTWDPQPIVVAMTGDPSDEVRDRARKQGAIECLQKRGLDTVGLGAAVLLAATHGRQERQRHGERQELLGRIDQLDAYVAAISHDLRAPITTASSMLTFIRQDEQLEDLSPTTRSMLDRVAELLSRGNQYADDLLQEARIGTEARGPLDLDSIVETAVRLAGLSPDAVTVGPLPQDLWGRAAALQQVVMNVLTNARRHASTSDPRVVISSERRPGRARLVIDDNGPGIPHEERERVFEIGVSDHAGGVGLATVRRQVKVLGGTVWVDEAPQLGGARIVIELPARDTR